MGHYVHIGENIQAQISFQEVTQLEKVKLKEDGNKKNEIKTCSYLNFDKCMYKAVATLMRNETADNCTTPMILENSKICTKPEDIKISYSIAVGRTKNQGRDCDLPCRSLSVGVGGKNKRTRNESYGEFLGFYLPRVNKMQEHYLYSYFNLIAEVGKKRYIFSTRLC